MKSNIPALPLLLAGLCVPTWASADTGAAAADASSQVADTSVPALPSNASDSGGFFGPVSVAQQAVTSGYQGGGLILGVGRNPMPMKFGNVWVYPGVRVGLGRNSNLLGTNPTVAAVSTSVFTVQPEVRAEVGYKGDRYGLTYAGNFTRYASSPADNFNTHSIELYGDNTYSARSHLAWGLGYQKNADPRGSLATGGGLSANPDTWHTPTARALYTYGASGAMGKVELEGHYFDKTYETNLATMSKLDYKSRDLAARFLYRVMPKTHVLFEVGQTRNDYHEAGGPAPDSTVMRYLLGATWEATAKTTGIVKVGQSRKSFDNATPDATFGSWQAIVRWMPKTYSMVEFNGGKSSSDSTGVGSYTMNTTYGLTWTHNWTSVWSTRLLANTTNTNYVNAGRDDDTRNLGVAVRYDMRRWLRLGLEWTKTDRSSNLTANDFSRNLTMFTVEGTL